MRNLKVSVLVDLVDKLTAPIRGISRVIRQVARAGSAEFKALAKETTDFGKALSLKVSAPLSAFGLLAIKKSADVESYIQSLATATGTMESARAAFAQITKFAATTPFALNEVLDAFIRLKNLGLDPSEAALVSYGNTSSAMGKTLNQMIEAVADAVTGEFERLKEFGIKASVEGKKVTFTFRGVKTTVKNDAAAIEYYLRRIGDVEFAGGMERQAQTLAGTWSNFTDGLTASLVRFGDVIVQTTQLKARLVQLGGVVDNLTSRFSALPKGLQETFVWVGIGAAVLGPFIILLGQLMMSIHFIVLGFGTLVGLAGVMARILGTVLLPVLAAIGKAIFALAAAIMATPVGWIITAILGVAAAGLLLYKYWEPLKKWWAGFWESIKAAVDSTVQWVADALASLWQPIQLLMDKLAGIGRLLGNTAVGRALFGGVKIETSTVQQAPAPVAGPYTSQQKTDDNYLTGQYGSPAAVPAPLGSSKVDTGGTVVIRVEQDGKLRVMQAKPNDPGMQYKVDTGLIMGGGL